MIIAFGDRLWNCMCMCVVVAFFIAICQYIYSIQVFIILSCGGWHRTHHAHIAYRWKKWICKIIETDNGCRLIITIILLMHNAAFFVVWRMQIQRMEWRWATSDWTNSNSWRRRAGRHICVMRSVDNRALASTDGTIFELLSNRDTVQYEWMACKRIGVIDPSTIWDSSCIHTINTATVYTLHKYLLYYMARICEIEMCVMEENGIYQCIHSCSWWRNPYVGAPITEVSRCSCNTNEYITHMNYNNSNYLQPAARTYSCTSHILIRKWCMRIMHD